MRLGWSALGFEQVGPQAGVAPGGLLRQGGFQQLVIGGQVGAAGWRMPEVIADCPATDIQTARVWSAQMVWPSWHKPLASWLKLPQPTLALAYLQDVVGRIPEVGALSDASSAAR